MATAVDSVVSPQPIRFNLKTLLLVITGVGILLTPVQWFGGAYLVSALMSLGLVASCTLAYRQSVGVALALAFVAVFVGIPLVMVAAVFICHAFLNFVLCILLALGHVRTKTFAFATAALAVGLYGFVLWDGYERVRELVALRAKYPLQSLEERLTFTQKASANANPQAAGPALTAAVVTNLGELEQHGYYSRYFDRPWALEELHENINTHFARAAGFGISRMGSIYPERVELEPQPPLKMPTPLVGVSAMPPTDELYPVHERFMIDFGNPDRMGYVRNRGAVAGFEPHRVTADAQLRSTKNDDKYWHVVRLELVSLLRHDTPRVYTADTLPQMDQLADVPHRALNEFEAAALPQLETAEDVVIDQQPDRIQMVGAVRAARQCVECHEGQRGRLLGAFSYEITPIVNTSQAAK